MVMIFMTLFISASNGRFANKAIGEMFKDLNFFTSIQLAVHALLPHISIWGGLGNELIVDDFTSFNTMIEIPHLLISMAILYILVYWRFKRVEA